MLDLSLYIFKYILEALAVAFVSKYVIGKNGSLREIALLTATITVALIILDQFAPGISHYTRQGAGFNLGLRIQGGGPMPGVPPAAALEGMDDPVAADYYSHGFMPSPGVQGKNAIYDTLTSSHIGGGGGLQAALGLQRTLKGESHDVRKGQNGGGGGLQAAMGLQRTLKGESHDVSKGQNGGCGGSCTLIGGGGGLQAAMGLQRTLKGESHDVRKAQSGGCGGCTFIGGGRVSKAEPMDDPVAQDYYSHGFVPSKGIKAQHPIYDTLIANSTEGFAEGAAVYSMPSVQVNVLGRFLDDRLAMNKRNASAVDEPFDTEAADMTAADRGLVYGTLPGEATGSRPMLYARDLISVRTRAGDKWILPDGTSNVIASKKTDLNDTLFKLRINLAEGNNPSVRTPIKYGDPINFAYNNEQAQTVLLNHNKTLNTLKNTQDTVFTLVKKGVSTGSSDPVPLGEEVYISTGGSAYLKVNADGTISTESDMAGATTFMIRSQKGCGPSWRFTK